MSFSEKLAFITLLIAIVSVVIAFAQLKAASKSSQLPTITINNYVNSQATQSIHELPKPKKP